MSQPSHRFATSILFQQLSADKPYFKMILTDFLRIAITLPSHYPGEAERIVEILEKGEAHLVHIRKPKWSAEMTAELIGMIPEKWHSRLKLHDQFELLDRFELAGVHLNSRNPIPPAKALSISKSAHFLNEIAVSDRIDYVTLSPVFDSISKEGYKAAFDLEKIRTLIQGKKIIALGGVTPEKYNYLKDLGFYGAAMSGYFFPPIK